MAKWQSQSYLWKYAIILCVIQGVTRVTSWPQLISNLLVAPACLQFCFWLAPHFFTPQVFLFSISLLFVNKYHYFIEVYIQMLLWSLILKNSNPRFFFNFHYRVIHQYTLRISELMQMICRGSKLWKKSTCSVITFHKYIQVFSIGWKQYDR